MAIISNNLTEAAAFLQQGDLIGIPTETVYGLAGNALNPDTVVNIFRVKQRPSFDPLIIHTDTLEKVEQYVNQIPDKASELAEWFWPGPLTLVLPKQEVIPDIVTSGLETVAVRIPNHPLTLKLLSKLEFPLAAPSANPFGYVSPTTADHVNDNLGMHIPFILDGGQTKIGIESTIISFTNNEMKLLRLGGISLEEIIDRVGAIDIQLTQSSNPQAPGMLEGHYAPMKKLILGNVDQGLLKHDPNRTGILTLNRVYPNVHTQHQITLSPSADLGEAAKNLFAALRQLDDMDIDIILAEELPERGLGRAINDRLRRASRG